jgi:hypothetical protein
MGALERKSMGTSYSLVFRRYAPFATFGGGFEGDNRTEPSTSLTATARTIGIVGFSPGSVGPLSTSSSGTAFSGAGAFVKNLLGKHISKVMGSVSVKTSTLERVRFTAQTAGANPMVPFAPDIDTYVDFDAVFSKSIIEINGVVRCDDFPNAEVFVLDAKGNATLMFAFATDGNQTTGPMTRLAGDHSGQSLGPFRSSIPIDSAGTFRRSRRHNHR